MRCMDEGRLRAYLDDELDRAERGAVAGHLVGCRACEGRIAELRENAAAVAATLDAWQPVAEPDHERAVAALAAFQARIREQGEPAAAPVATRRTSGQLGMKERIAAMMMRHSRLLAPGRRPVFAAVALLALFGLLLTLGPVQTLAGGVMQQFRVRQFQAVTVPVPGMAALPQPRDLTDAEKTQMMTQLQAMLGPLGTLETDAKPTSARAVTAAEAEAFFKQQYGGAAPRLPQNLPTELTGLQARYGVVDKTKSTYHLNAAVATQYLGLINRPELNELKLPATGTLDFTLEAPAAMVAAYGDETNGFAIVQLASPVLTLPAEDQFDIDAFRTAVLAMPNIPQATKDQVQGVTDWKNTLIIPVPEDAKSKKVDISTGRITNTPGLLIEDGQGRGVLLLWAHDGILYGVGGHLSPDQAKEIADGMMR